MSTLARTPGHRHEALLYRGEDEFVGRVAAFLREGVEAGEEVLVAVSPPKFALLTEALGDAAGGVGYLDMDEVGRNPGRLISAWHDWAAARPGRALRGVGEPVTMARTPAETAECHASEALWNVAFAGHDLWVLCPYDTAALAPDRLASVERTHPAVIADGVATPSARYSQPWTSVLTEPLTEPGQVHTTLAFGSLQRVRDAVADAARRAGAGRGRAEDLVIAVNEVACNSVRHGGGSGTLRVWEADGAVVCEVRDQGRLKDPLVGRLRPEASRVSGR
ncbi:MAG TPA: anti-sigma factor RsbA family regulatory protein, partial [Egibacteraceae bacterium]|nr:anti-sigma factor RsbA family regulatory protein [Egibacteraceae bacterium]